MIAQRATRSPPNVWRPVDQKAGNSIIRGGQGELKTYLLPIGDTNDLESAIEAEAVAISDQYPRLLETLVGIGGRYFSDWPFSYDRQNAKSTDQSKMNILWRGSEREGVISFNRPLDLAIPDGTFPRRVDHTLGAITDSLLELDLGKLSHRFLRHRRPD